MIELEKTYLAKYIPEGLEHCESKEILDIYVPEESEHPKLRIRKNGEKYEITKKQPGEENDASSQEEQTINLTKEEFSSLIQVKGKRVRKIRYFYYYNGRIAEIDIFQDALEGLILVDFEFENEKDKESFEKPEFCLADVTHEEFTAGGMICGKSYEDIKFKLEDYGYEKISLE